MKELFLGNEAVARGLYEASCTVGSSYPGTPSTEVTEYAATYAEINCEWAPNEKVALEVACGASIAGARAFSGMKHVGLNVAADPLFTASYTGVNGGLVVIVADDPGMHSSQNEQDSRHYARAAKIMMLEPADSEECLQFTKLAFALSERFDTPVFLRLTTRIAHSRSLVTLREREDAAIKPYEKNPQKYVMMPAMARGRHVLVEERIVNQTAFAEKEAFETGLNSVEYNDKKIGVISSGINYQYAKQALGENASYLKLGCVYPLPVDAIRDFAAQCETVYVIEDLDDIIESHCKKHGINVIGKEKFPLLGEFSQKLVREIILDKTPDTLSADIAIPPRPPVLCAGCPHRAMYYTLKKERVFVSGDIGCYTLGSLAPLGMMDTCICMGASVSALHGRNLVDPANAKKSVAVIGDSTFMHSGITGLVDIAYNGTNSVVMILDNSITGMTGHQQNPTTGLTLKGDPAAAVNLEELCRAVGIRDVQVVDPNDLTAMQAAVKAALAADEPSVIISRRPCALLKSVKHNPPLQIDAKKCTGCKACMRIGCPAISFKDGKTVIDFTQCVGCGVCTQLCRFDAIS